MINFFIFKGFFYRKELACFEIHKRHGDWFFSPPNGGNNIVVYSSRRLESKRNFTGSTGRFCIFYSHRILWSCSFFYCGIVVGFAEKNRLEIYYIVRQLKRTSYPLPHPLYCEGWRGFSPLPKLGCCVMVIHKKMRETDEILYIISLKRKEIY